MLARDLRQRKPPLSSGCTLGLGSVYCHKSLVPCYNYNIYLLQVKYRLDDEALREGKFRIDENTGTLFTRSGFEEDVGFSYTLNVSVNRSLITLLRSFHNNIIITPCCLICQCEVAIFNFLSCP